MNTTADAWPSARVFHLTGGVKAYNIKGPVANFEPPVVAGSNWQMHLTSYRDTYRDLQALGLQVIGVDFYHHAMEIKGMAPPDWRVFSRGWPSDTLAQTWTQISNGAFEAKNGQVWDLASRIAQQVRTCIWQLRQVSQAYEAQLVGRSRQGKTDSKSRFNDGFTGIAYIAIQSYLVDACVLRDYLAEFLCGVAWAKFLPESDRKINSMSRLRKDALKSVPRPNALADTLETATSPGAWLQLLGTYRNLVVHTAPLAMAGGRWFAIIEHRSFPQGQFMPIVRLPLPADPRAVKAEHQSVERFADFNGQFEAFTRAVKGEVPWVDGLDYLWQSHAQLAAVAAEVAKVSPVAGKMMTFDDSNIIGEIRRQQI